MAFMAVFTGQEVLEFLVLLSVYFPEPGISETVNPGTDLCRGKGSGSVDTQAVRRAAPGTCLAFNEFSSFFFPFLRVAFHRDTCRTFHNKIYLKPEISSS
jgi:hypothetical protein